MKTLRKTSGLQLLVLHKLILVLLFTSCGRLFSQELKEETWKFPKKDTLSLKTIGSTKIFISGNNSGRIEIKLQYASKTDETFELTEKGNEIYLKEFILNYDSHRPTKTYFEDWIWTITVPHGTYIKCEGGLSDFEVTDFNGSFKANCASGDFILTNVNGNIEISSADSDTKINTSKGSFNISSASGSIKADEIYVTGISRFRSTTGSVKISLSQTPTEDIYAESAHNKVQLNFNGHDITGYFEFIARADEGRISCPYKFDNEETFLDDIKRYRNSSDFEKKGEYNRKSFIKDDSKPKITIRTITGTAQLVK